MSASVLDEICIIRMARGDAAAFEELYLASASIVYGYALSILRDKHDAEDAMHDAFIRIYQNAGSYKPMGKPLAWMLTIVRNLCFDKIGAANATVDLDGYEATAPIVEEQASIDHLMLEKALQVLGLQERQIVVLHALSGLKHREIAELLEIPLGTVLSKYQRALRKLRAKVGEGDAR